MKILKILCFPKNFSYFSLPSEAFGFGLTALNQKIYFVKSDEGPGLGRNCLFFVTFLISRNFFKVSNVF